MKREDISRAITGIEDEYIEEAAEADRRGSKRRRITRWTAAAAACLCAAVVIAAVPHLRRDEPKSTSTGGIDNVTDSADGNGAIENNGGVKVPQVDADYGFSGIVNRVQAADLMEGIVSAEPNGIAVDERFAEAQTNFAVELFKGTVSNSHGQNVLVSPLSISLTLALAANGACGQTLAEMEYVLGGGMTVDELNRYMKGYTENLPDTKRVKLSIASSVWFPDDGTFSVNRDFLQANGDWYGAAARMIPFGDPASVDLINNWVKEETDGLIDGIVEELDPATVMHLVNALTFNANWKEQYYGNDVRDGVFTALSGDAQPVTMMRSTESTYLNDGRATGFIKEYANAANGNGFAPSYYFAALMPNEGVGIYDYIASLTGDGLRETLTGAEDAEVWTSIPKFSYEFDTSMVNVLSGMGMNSAFDPSAADFRNLSDSELPVYIGDVRHKTFIDVNEKGTKAAAVTDLYYVLSADEVPPKTVILDRPFVYMIVDDATDLPIFMGAVTSVE